MALTFYRIGSVKKRNEPYEVGTSKNINLTCHRMKRYNDVMLV